MHLQPALTTQQCHVLMCAGGWEPSPAYVCSTRATCARLRRHPSYYLWSLGVHIGLSLGVRTRCLFDTAAGPSVFPNQISASLHPAARACAVVQGPQGGRYTVHYYMPPHKSWKLTVQMGCSCCALAVILSSYAHPMTHSGVVLLCRHYMLGFDVLALQDGCSRGREANALRAVPVLYLLCLGEAASTWRVFLGPSRVCGMWSPPNHIYYLPTHTHARHALPAACVRVCCTCTCVYNQKTDGV